MWPIKLLGLWLVGALAITIPLSRINLTEYYRLSRGVRTHGVVTGLEPANHQTVHYTYQVGGKTYSGAGQAGFGNPEFCLLSSKQDVIVYYLSDEPSKSCIGIPAGLIKNESASIALAGIIFPFIGVLGWSYRYAPFRRWLFR